MKESFDIYDFIRNVGVERDVLQTGVPISIQNYIRHAKDTGIIDGVVLGSRLNAKSQKEGCP